MSECIHSQTRALRSLSAPQTVCSLSRRKTNVTYGAACFSARVHYTTLRINRFELFLTFLFDFLRVRKIPDKTKIAGFYRCVQA